MPNPLSALPIIDKILGIFQEWQKNRPVNKLRYRIEAAIDYVLVDMKEGEYEGIDDKEQTKLKLHFRKRIFDE